MSTLKEIVTTAPIYITTTDALGIETRIMLPGGLIEIGDFGMVVIHGVYARVEQGPAARARPRLADGEIM